MGKVRAATERTIDAPADKVRELVADYSGSRAKILTDAFFDYSVIEGGTGAGTKATWKLQATSNRVRDIAVTVTESEDSTVVETDANSSMVIVWRVRETGERCVVRVEATWDGAGGVGGIFEKIFAPKGLQRIYAGVLANLDNLAQKS